MDITKADKVPPFHRKIYNDKWNALIEQRHKEWVKCAERAYIEIPAEIRKKRSYKLIGLKDFITEDK